MSTTVLELGRRLAERGQLSRPSDVFLLEIGEAVSALTDGNGCLDLAGRREREQAWARRLHPGPATYGRDPAAPPSFAVLPRKALFAHKAFEWYRDRIFAMDQPAVSSAAGDLQGVAASPGTYRGRVRRVMDETEFDSVQPGDVLVSPTTSPAWSVLFSRIGALVTDTGGILSHPAIIAREYGIPAVVATGCGTAELDSGDVVTVDGTAGVVRWA